MDVLSRIKDLLKERKITMYQLSQRAGIPQSTLSNLFLRNNAPTISTLEKICNALDISISEFFGSQSEVISQDELLSEWNLLSNDERKSIYKLIKTLNRYK